MGLFKNFINQTRKPEGFLGKIMLKGMNFGHAKVAEWGMSHLQTITPQKILDIGCGGGRNAAELLKKYSDSKVTAIDYSPLAVEEATSYNKQAIEGKRCFVQQGDVSSLEFDNGSYDLITAFETVYFWPGLEKCFTEVFRVLKTGGCFMILNESDGVDSVGKKFEKMIEGMKAYTADEIKTALTTVGFTNIKIIHHKENPWICVIAEK